MKKFLFLFLAASASFAAEEPNHQVHQALRQLKTVMSKALNEGDVDDIPEHLRRRLRFEFADRVDRVLELALE